VKPQRPYLLRALHEWIIDSGATPHIVVDATVAGVIVPSHHVKDEKIILNVSFSATQMLKLGNEFVTFDARFDGASFSVKVPIRAVVGIYARETGLGQMFTDVDAGPDPGDKSPPTAGKRPRLQVVK
jgi:stringent starvation protein B